MMMNRWMVDDETRQVQRLHHDIKIEQSRRQSIIANQHAIATHPPPLLTLPSHLTHRPNTSPNSLSTTLTPTSSMTPSNNIVGGVHGYHALHGHNGIGMMR
jgi:hypothetical protein